MKSLKLVIGTFFGSGMLPKAPGTWGSLAAIPFIYLTALYFSFPGVLIFLIISCLLSLWSTSVAVEKYGDDPSQFVMDEVAGQSVVFLIVGFQADLSHDIWILIAGFIFFRLFDIIKPLGINRMEKLPGKFGILLDDLLAGFYALICMEVLFMITSSL